MCLEQAKRKENFKLCFVRIKDNRQQFFSGIWNEYFEIWEYGTLVAHRHWKEQWRRSITEERLALTLKSFHRNVLLCIICCPYYRQNRLNTSQHAAVVLNICRLSTLFVKCGSVVFRFVPSGNSQKSMSFSYIIAPPTVNSIIVSTCDAI